MRLLLFSSTYSNSLFFFLVSLLRRAPNGYISPLNSQRTLRRMAKRETTAVRAAFSISQCVTKRARQLERLQFTLEATVRKIRACTPPSDATFLYSAKTQIQSQRDFALLLLQFLQQEERADTPQLFDTALPLEVRVHEVGCADQYERQQELNDAWLCDSRY